MVTSAGSTHDPTVDFGLVQQLALGNYVWYDTNDNGEVDVGEEGLSDVDVELYQDSDGDGVFTPGADTYLGTTATDASGHYTFTDLLPSRYRHRDVLWW